MNQTEKRSLAILGAIAIFILAMGITVAVVLQ